MKKILNFFILLLSILGTFNSQAQDEKLISKVLVQLNLKPKDMNMDFIQTKVLPYAKDKTVLVIPKYETNQDDDEFYVYDAYIVIADNKSGQILNKYFEKNKWVSDAIRLDGFTIDTGLYTLSDKIRAFGVRVSYTGSSRVNPYGATDLSLYIPTKNGLKQIADEINIELHTGEWDGNCNGEFQSQEITIDLDNEKTNGFYNLILRNKITNTITTPNGDDCDEKISTSNQTKKLKYNGKTYE